MAEITWRTFTPKFIRRAGLWVLLRLHLMRHQRVLDRWKLSFLVARLRRRMAGAVPEDPSIEPLKNSLQNRGGIPLADLDKSPADIIAEIQDPNRRQTHFEGFEGLALDDALYVAANELYHYSYWNLARAIARVTSAHCGRISFSVLELGCGGGNMRHFFRTLGTTSYLGVDANTLAFEKSPFIKDSPGNYRNLDLQQKIDFGRTFDLVMSFELLEHIAEDKLDNLLWTVRRHMAAGSLFLCTASTVDVLDVHVTVHERRWWLERFAACGLVPTGDSSACEGLLCANRPWNWSPAITNVFALGPGGATAPES